MRQLAEAWARLGDVGCCGQINQITSGRFRGGCRSLMTAVAAMAGAKMETEVASVFSASGPLGVSLVFLTYFSTCSLFALLPTSTWQEVIGLGINVTRNNKVVDINAPEPSRSLITLASRQAIITGNKEQPASDPFTTQLWPFDNQGKASALPSCPSAPLTTCSLSSDCNNNNGLPPIELKLLPSSALLNSSHRCRYPPLSLSGV